jgi:hypothetical protein
MITIEINEIETKNNANEFFTNIKKRENLLATV